jgi:hypothetical protein
LTFGGLFFGTQCFDFGLRLIGGASAFHRIGSGFGLYVRDLGKHYRVGKTAALARAKPSARQTAHGDVEQPTDGPRAVATERGGYLVHWLEPGRWQADADHRVVAGAWPTGFSTAFFHGF